MPIIEVPNRFTGEIIGKFNIDVGANLSAANLTNIIVNWRCHYLVAEILLRWAGSNWNKIKLAGGIQIAANLNWCWDKFIALATDEPLAVEAIAELQKWIRDGDDAPEWLKNYEK